METNLDVDFDVKTLKECQSLGKKSITESKYVIIFDKTGNAPAFFRYSASLHEVEKEQLRAKLAGKSEDEITNDVVEVMRKSIVLGAAYGKTVVLDIGGGNGKILADAKEGSWPSYKIWDFKEWRKRDNHIEIVKPEEMVDQFGNNAYEMKKEMFTIVILAKYQDDAFTRLILNRIPNSDKMLKYYVE